MLEHALEYLRRGWQVIPVPYRGKDPGRKGWQRLRLTVETALEFFDGQPQNIGLLVGQPSGWIVDVDLDHPRAIELAPEFLPPTCARFGRPSKPLSHWLYRGTGPVATKKISSKSAGMIVELRSTGLQTVVPPSVHCQGECIAWDVEGAEPAEIDPDVLLQCVIDLGTAVKVELGEKQPKKRSERLQRVTGEAKQTAHAAQEVSAEERQAMCLAAMLAIGIVDHNDGSRRLFTAACRAVEHNLGDQEAISVLRQYQSQRPFPSAWTDDDFLKRVRDAERQCERGKALSREADGTVCLGNRDPASGKLVLSPKRTLPTAHAYVRDFHLHSDAWTIRSYASTLLEWRGNRYIEAEDGAIQNRLQAWLHEARRYVFNKQKGELQLVPFESNPATVNAALETIRNLVHLPAVTTCPSWLDALDRPPPEEVLPCRSFLLHLPTSERLAPTPAFFSTNALEFDPDKSASPPQRWFKFLHELFDGDCESLDLLQQWFGYCLTGDTSQQKMMLIVGPRRSGKGTIARVLRHLVGLGNVCGPTTASLATQFGLQPLIGKTLAVVSDARFSGDDVVKVVERLLCISGEDAVSVDRKYLGSITMKLPTRFLFLSNELPKLHDVSGALAGRFLILRLMCSFYGREDRKLTNKLLAELPGILNWAIDGWKLLHESGRFIVPESANQLIQDVEDLSSPVGAFVREECIVQSGQRVWVDDLYAAWKAWCQRDGRTVFITRQSFGRDLLAAVPTISTRRNRGVGRFYEGIGLSSNSEANVAEPGD